MKKWNIKRWLKIILANIIGIVALIVVLEFAAYIIDNFNVRDSLISNNKFNLQTYPLKVYSFGEFYEINKNRDGFFRPDAGTEYQNKSPILLLGCSYTYGAGLKDEETFGFQLANFTKRCVINKAYSGWGVNTALFQLKHDDDFRQIKAPEYVIYTFIAEHIGRMMSSSYFPYQFFFQPEYKINKENCLQEQPAPSILYKSYFVRSLDRYFKYTRKNRNNEEAYNKIFDLLKMHIIEMNNEIKRLYPNAKLVVLKYPSYETWYMETSRWQELTENDIIVLDAEKLTDINLIDVTYTISKKDVHPNAKAWEIIVPKLAEVLNL